MDDSVEIKAEPDGDENAIQNLSTHCDDAELQSDADVSSLEMKIDADSTDLITESLQDDQPSTGESCVEVKFEADSNDITEHPRDDNKPRAFSCTVCNKQFTRKASLKCHKRMHAGQKSADYSGKNYVEVDVETDSSDVTKHPHGKPHKPRSSMWRAGGKRFTTKGNLRKYKLKHRGEKLYPCTQCEKCYSTKQCLKKHLNVHSGRYKCRDCGKCLQQKQALTVHKRRHSEEKTSKDKNLCSGPGGEKRSNKRVRNPIEADSNGTTVNSHDDYLCTVCNKQFTSNASLKTHKLTHSDVRLYSCTECGKSYTTPSYLRKHMNVHGSKFKCTECEKCFTNNQALTVHRQSHSGQKPSDGPMLHACTQCEKRFPDPYRLHSHMNVHTDKHRCSECGKCFRSNRELKLHMPRHSDEKPLECPVCNKRFGRSPSLVVHMRMHTDDKRYKCHLCDMGFFQLGHLHRHLRVHTADKTAEKQYMCSMCSEMFTQSGNLKVHMQRVHTDGRPFECPECRKLYKTRRDLRLHFSVHSEKKHTCSHCGERFTWIGQLRVHRLQSHNEGTWFTCHVCEKKFTYSSHLAVHLLRHRGVKPYLCCECSKCFYTAGELKDHEQSHSDAKPFCCGSCGKLFKRKAGVSAHIKRCPNLTSRCSIVPSPTLHLQCDSENTTLEI